MSTTDIPTDFDPWGALLDLGADLIHVQGRWICVHGRAEYMTLRTQGGLGVVWADPDGTEAVWRCWSSQRGAEHYPKGKPNEVWVQRGQRRIHLLAPRAHRPFWRAFTVEGGPSGRPEPSALADHEVAEEAVWSVVCVRGGAAA